jgi:antitoxin CptB
MDSEIDPRALSRLRWRCRRGMLENDLLIERFFAKHGDALTRSQASAMESLMALSDNDLLDLLLARTEPEGPLARPDVIELLSLLRPPAAAHP